MTTTPQKRLKEDEPLTWRELCMLLLGILIGFVWMLVWRAFNLI